jgi:hypothetical protein
MGLFLLLISANLLEFPPARGLVSSREDGNEDGSEGGYEDGHEVGVGGTAPLQRPF